MASLAAHFTASLFLCPLGVRRLFCSVSLYLRNPSLYRSRIWYLSEHKWKNFDLYTLLLVLPIGSLFHILIFLAFSDSPAYRFSFLQHLDLCLVPDGFIFIFAGIAFATESYMCGRGVVGLGGAVYGILGGLAAFCAACCLYLSVRPSAFFAEFLLSSGLLLKGTWVLQVGLSLYTDAFSLKGCEKISGQTLAKGEIDVKCELQDDMWRGMVLMNLVFIVHVILVMTTSFVLFGLLHRNRNMRWGQGSGLLPAEIGSESMLMHPLPELEME
ncbi:UNVERIFIED_CONTAM: hypothetical protein Sangu_0116000 [Sesamum angustifolium]|uniref:Transmembrane protein n=1 Tax=Sesamum angustifolium TaxID=2727405 RepID=A0AAW2RKC4_9LAMI